MKKQSEQLIRSLVLETQTIMEAYWGYWDWMSLLTWFSLYGLRWWEAQAPRMTIMIRRAPQEARIAISVLLSVFTWSF